MQDLEKAVASILGKDSYNYGDWELLPSLYDGCYSAWISVVVKAYVVNGTVKEVSAILAEAEDVMKELGDKYSDYMYYPELKEYFLNTVAFFDSCKNPEGNVDQINPILNDYRNTARIYFSALKYVFEDSIDV